VGDWVLVERRTGRAVRALARQSALARLAAGEPQRRQLIAANVDSLFIVTSCNNDFNPSRLERYLALAREAGVEPVVVLTKSDLATDIDRYMDRLRDIAPHVIAIPVNATSAESTSALSPWLSAGQTVAFVGSSGVGKSTLVNTLSAAPLQGTAGIREDDSKGRHTTTARHMFALPGGAWVIDTPGMRELKLEVGAEALGAVFSDIEAMAQQCRFRDCAHQGDEGCAVSAAIERGDLDERRLASYRKLQREAIHAARTVRQRRESERNFSRTVKSVLRKKRMDRGQE
jgi:ribosome biogenesis GTPase